MSEAAVGEPALLRQRDQFLDIGPQFLGLGGRGQDLFVLDERGRHVAEQGCAVAGGALELTSGDAMTHGLAFRSSGDRAGPSKRATGTSGISGQAVESGDR